MAKIYQYQKTSDAYTEYRVSGEGVTELVTIDGITYLSVAGELPPHDSRLMVTEAVMTDDLRGWIKATSPHTLLIHQRMQEKIRQQYSLEDEAYFSRIGVGVALGAYTFQLGEQDAVLAYGAYVESVRQWGRDQRAALGL
jgi:hypothetical protein